MNEGHVGIPSRADAGLMLQRCTHVSIEKPMNEGYIGTHLLIPQGPYASKVCIQVTIEKPMNEGHIGTHLFVPQGQRLTLCSEGLHTSDHREMKDTLRYPQGWPYALKVYTQVTTEK